jgi:hypothetical protein
LRTTNAIALAASLEHDCKEPVYRADVDKISGWRIHLQYDDGQIHLKDLIEGQKHDSVLEQIKAKKERYEKKAQKGR